MRYSIQGAGSSQWSRQFDPDNVAIDSAGLHLTVQPPVSDDSVPSAGIYTNRCVHHHLGFKNMRAKTFHVADSRDFHFGAYHFEAQATDQPGTVSAFYVYEDDENEVRIMPLV
jgi:hypothetical protein